ncbi:MAG TPA: DinB family protein [Bacteroidota bacterium]|nr:DinB family protein [Bacteroidota bacterium]
MKYSFRLLVVAALFVFSAAHALADEAKGFKADLIGQIEFAQKEVMDLENAIPDAKMSWRPNDQVRSVSEVYMHIAYANYLLLSFAGVTPPAGMSASPEEATKWEKMTTNKKEIAEHLQKSFDFLKDAIKKTPEANLENPVTFFGQKTTVRGLMLTVLSHVHEHLGQSIAYARMVGVVPPWTAAQQAAEKMKKG